MDKNLEHIKQLFSELYDLAEKTWPAYTTKERHCDKCKKTYGVNYESDEYDVIYCQKCGGKLEQVPKPREYHWPHVHRLYAMMNYRANSNKKDWKKVVDATDYEFHFMDRH